MITPWMAISLVAIALVVMLAILKIEQKDALRVDKDHRI
jgi:hypothetical protein